MGNSEVGHLNLGAGRVVRQDLVRIDEDVESGRVLREPGAGRRPAAVRGSHALHLMGLVSDGGVHSHIGHLQALLELARRQGVERVHVHAFTDGRDVSPTSGAGFLEEVPELATVVGRYYGMDRDRRWDRTKRAYDALVHGVGEQTDDPVAAVRASYERGVTDEFVEPLVVGDPAQGRIAAGDTVICFNFRPDRMRQIVHALIDPGFAEFDRGPEPPLPSLVQMTEYAADIHAPVAYPLRVAGGRACPGAGGRRRRTAPCGGDREVPARHLLLRRRQRAAKRRARSGGWSTRRATCPPTTMRRR